MSDPQIPSSIWFHQYDKKVTSDEWPEEWRPVKGLENPGETVFVPNRSMHLVFNYASEWGPFERIWEKVVINKPTFAKRTDLVHCIIQHHTNASNNKEEWVHQFELPITDRMQ
jgi:hypothetical protein